MRTLFKYIIRFSYTTNKLFIMIRIATRKIFLIKLHLWYVHQPSLHHHHHFFFGFCFIFGISTQFKHYLQLKNAKQNLLINQLSNYIPITFITTFCRFISWSSFHSLSIVHVSNSFSRIQFQINWLILNNYILRLMGDEQTTQFT